MRFARVVAAALMVALVAPSAGCVDKPTEHRVRANAYLRGGDAAEALKECDLGLQKTPKDPSLLILRGKALFELDRLDESKTAYLAAITAGKAQQLAASALGEAQLGLAIIAMRTTDLPEAKARFTILVDNNAKDADARINLARVCLQMKDMDCAVKQAEEAGKLRGRSEDVLFTLGRIYLVAKKYAEAEKTFKHICEVVPGAASCPYGVALVAAQQGDTAKALEQLREAVKRQLPNPSKLASDPLLAPLKDNAEFQALSRKASSG